MHQIAGVLASTILVLSFSSAASAQSVTYDFTGTTTETGVGDFSSAASGDSISGTFTFDYSAPTNPGLDTGTVGSPSAFSVTTDLGSSSGSTSTSTALLFSMTAQVGGVSYATVPVSPGNAKTTSNINAFSGPGYSYLTASNETFSSCGPCTAIDESLIQFYSPLGLTYDSTGLPLLDPSSNGNTGVFYNQLGSEAFVISSITPVSMVAAVPEPSTYAMMLAGLALLFASTRRSKSMRLVAMGRDPGSPST